MARLESSQREDGVTALQPPEVLEPRLTPMWMCCGHWSYTFGWNGIGPTISVTWTEDGPCKDY